MHLHYFTLSALADELQSRLKGAVLGDCFSQSKDELVLGFGKGDEETWLRVNCEPAFVYLAAFAEFRKAKRNAVTLFRDLLGTTVEKLEVVPWDRCLLVDFGREGKIAFKMHGQQSNVIHFTPDGVKEIFRTGLQGDEQFEPRPGQFEADWKTKFNPLPEEVADTLRKISPALDKPFADFTRRQMDAGLSFADAFDITLSTAADKRFTLQMAEGKIRLLLFPSDAEKTVQVQGAMQALQLLVKSRFVFQRYQRAHQEITQVTRKQIKKLKDLSASAAKGLETALNERDPEELGNLIMAQLHKIKKGDLSVMLEDYYTGGETEVKLRQEADPQQNAAQYYQKSRKRKARITHLQSQQGETDQKLFKLLEAEEQLNQLPQPEALELSDSGIDPQWLRKLELFLAEHERIIRAGGDPEMFAQKHPFMEFKLEGFTILVGRNAKSNDELTFHYSKREDLWLHVKDAPGSHVIVRKQPGREYSKNVIRFAASLAATYSTRKTEGLVPVTYTPRKFVRKLKGAPAGAVVVDREEIVLAEPVER